MFYGRQEEQFSHLQVERVHGQSSVAVPDGIPWLVGHQVALGSVAAERERETESCA